VTVRASFDHIHLAKINAFLASLQASHQKKMFELCGVDVQSQTAYELAVQGPLRPSTSDVPLIYSLRCIDLRRPYFTIGKFLSMTHFLPDHFHVTQNHQITEIHAVNESESYLGILIHEIALNLKTVAHCTQVRCIRQSHFTLEDTLLRRHWGVENILKNMDRCQKLINSHPEIIKQHEATLHEEEKQ
jgi:mitochondrial mRNA pseudouridine synthase TRUB2